MGKILNFIAVIDIPLENTLPNFRFKLTLYVRILKNDKYKPHFFHMYLQYTCNKVNVQLIRKFIVFEFVDSNPFFKDILYVMILMLMAATGLEPTTT